MNSYVIFLNDYFLSNIFLKFQAREIQPARTWVIDILNT